MKTANSEAPSSKPAPISDAELADILENSPWAKMQRQANELATMFEAEKAA